MLPMRGVLSTSLVLIASSCAPRNDDVDRQKQLEVSVRQSSEPPEASTSSAVTSASASASVVSDGSIDRLVDKLDKNHLWDNGHFPELELPHTASAEAVVSEIFSLESAGDGKPRHHHTLEIREVHIGSPSYTAVLMDTEAGRKIVLLRYRSDNVGWWSRTFDVD
jgi:hypothetical protein